VSLYQENQFKFIFKAAEITDVMKIMEIPEIVHFNKKLALVRGGIYRFTAKPYLSLLFEVYPKSLNASLRMRAGISG